MKQLPPERSLPQKQAILDRVRADAAPTAKRQSWFLPVAAAASIAVIAGGVLAAPSLLGSDPQAPVDQAQPQPQAEAEAKTTLSSGPVTQRIQNQPLGAEPGGIPVDAGRLTSAQAAEFAAACVERVGAKVERVLHATQVRSDVPPAAPAWTVVVKSGAQTYGCVGQLKPSAQRSAADIAFTTFPSKAKSGVVNGAAGLVDNAGNAVDKASAGQWLVAGQGASTVRQRLVLAGKPGPWFATEVVDGLAYVRSWDEAVLKVGDKVTTETQQLTRDGKLVGATEVQDHTLVKATK